MYSLFLLNSSSFPSLDVTTMTEFLSKTFPRASIRSPNTHLQLLTSIQQSDSPSTLFLLLNNKKKNAELQNIAYELFQRERKFLIYYIGLQGSEGRTVKTYDEIVLRVKGEFYGEKMMTMMQPVVRGGKIVVASVESQNREFRNLINALRGKIQQSNNANIQFKQNYNFSNHTMFEESPYSILILDDEDLYRYQGYYSNLLNKVSKNKLVTIIYSKTATIPYGFRFDQLVTNEEQLVAKTMWFVRENSKNVIMPERHNTLIESLSSTNKEQGFRSVEYTTQHQSPSYKRTSLINKQNQVQIEQDENTRRKSMQSQVRRQSRRQRSSIKEEFQLNFNWVCKKKPSGTFATISQSEFRKHGIKKTMFGNEGQVISPNGKINSIMQRRQSSLLKDRRDSSTLRDRRESSAMRERRESRESALLKSELQKLQTSLQQQPSIMVMAHHSSIKTPSPPPSQLQSHSAKVMTFQTSSPKLTPRRHSSTAGYNQLNLQQLLQFQQNLPQTDSIPSTMSFGSIQSTSKNVTEELTQNFSQFQNNYYNTSQLTSVLKNAPRIESTVSSLQLSGYQRSGVNPRMISENSKIVRSSEIPRSKPRLSTLKFRIPTIYIPSSLPNLKYLINVTYPNQFSIIQYRNLAQLQKYIENLDGSFKPTVIFDQYYAIQAKKIIDFNKQDYMRAIVYVPAQQNINPKGFSGLVLANSDHVLLLEVDKTER